MRPSLTVSLCAFMHVIVCVHMCREERERERGGPVKVSEVEGSIKMMFDMRKEAVANAQ